MLLRSFRLPVERLSATSLMEFVSCAESFRLKRLKKIPERHKLDRFLGTVHHRAVAENFRQKTLSGEDLDWKAMEQVYDDEWAETIQQEGEPEWEVPPSEAGATGLKVLECFMRDAAPLVNPVKVEEWFEVKVPGVPVPVVGVIDVESRGFVEEFKTAARKEAKAKPRWRFQGRIYQLSVPKPVAWYVTTKQVTPVTYTAVDNPGLLMDPINPDVTARLVLQTVEILNDTYARYGADRTWPTNGLLHEWLCQSACSYGPKSPNPICPAWRNGDASTVG